MSLEVICLALCAVAVAATDAEGLQRPEIPTAVPLRVSVKDPCEVAPAATLKNALAIGLAPYCPISESKDGEKVTVSEPTITSVTCPNLKISLKVSARYQKTRGFPQFSASGTARFTSPLELRVAHPMYIGAGQPIPAGDVRSAKACLTDINAVELNINNVPIWLDNGWLREKLLEPFLASKCVDVTNLVRLFIQQGGLVNAS